MRFNSLLDATRDLLETLDFTEIGIYDIAAQAKVKPSSAYHFFPTPDAAFLALAKRYLAEQLDFIQRPFDRSAIQNWPDLINLRYDRAVEFLNSNLPYRKLFLSGNSAEIRRYDYEHVDQVSSISYDWLNEYVVMPYLPNHQQRYTVLIGVWDGVWATSYARHGEITEWFVEEGRKAGLAYLRTFLPEVLPLRPPPVADGASPEA